MPVFDNIVTNVAKNGSSVLVDFDSRIFGSELEVAMWYEGTKSPSPREPITHNAVFRDNSNGGMLGGLDSMAAITGMIVEQNRGQAEPRRLRLPNGRNASTFCISFRFRNHVGPMSEAEEYRFDL